MQLENFRDRIYPNFQCRINFRLGFFFERDVRERKSIHFRPNGRKLGTPELIPKRGENRCVEMHMGVAGIFRQLALWTKNILFARPGGNLENQAQECQLMQPADD